MTIDKLLNTREYRHNQSLLARELKINRGTFRKYMNDIDGNYHFIKRNGNDLQMFTNVTNKI